MCKAKIKEYFVSIQGEGPYVGYRQLFLRFCGCNLNCSYCDTDFVYNDDCIELSPSELYNLLNKNNMFDNIHSISLTGGEPLIYADFLKQFLPLLGKKVKIFLETNATLIDQLLKIIDYIDIISADIKLPSSSGMDLFDMHAKFFDVCTGKEVFAKVVFDGNISDSEIKRVCEIAEKSNAEVIFSPVIKRNLPVVSGKEINTVLCKAATYYPKVRVIPQLHRFIGVE